MHGCACTRLLVSETRIAQESWCSAFPEDAFNRAAIEGD
jgi:hypothetical protein